MLKLTLIVLAVILLGGALYAFANEKGILKAEEKKAIKSPNKNEKDEKVSVINQVEQ